MPYPSKKSEPKFLMKTIKKKPMSSMKKMEPIEKIDYEADFEKALSEYTPKKKAKRKTSGKMNPKDSAQLKQDLSVLTKGMKK